MWECGLRVRNGQSLSDKLIMAAALQIGNHTIKLSMLNKDSKWTKALKLMLANLKVGTGAAWVWAHSTAPSVKHPLIISCKSCGEAGCL